MLTPTIRQLITRVEQLENSLHAPEAERLAVWRDLVNWFAWAGQQADLWQSFSALPMDSPIRTLKDNLMWCFRFFAPMIPDTCKNGGWVDKAKILIETFINACLAEMSPTELGQQQHFDACILWTVERLQDTELWAEYDKRREQDRTRQTQPAEKPEAQPVTIIDNPATESDSASSGGVTANGYVKILYVGGSVGFNILTITGPEPAIKGRQYTVTTEVWQNLQEFSIGRWEKIQ